MCAHIYVQFRILMGPKWFPPGLYAPFMDLVFLLFLSLILTLPCCKFSGSLLSLSILVLYGPSHFQFLEPFSFVKNL